MHNLAITLSGKGYNVTGSDDEIYEPARSNLSRHGLLPDKTGWNPESVTANIDIVILGMHAREDNPELIRARELGLKIMSFPEYIHEMTRFKKRIVVSGSHGKTTITAMIMHVFRYLGIKFDFMAGSALEGYDTMVGLSDDSVIAVLEGDEYLTSPIDRRPKFHLYMPDIAILNGIAWDHVNVFPTFGNYVEQFRIFIEKITEGGSLIYYDDDPEVRRLAMASGRKIKKIPYRVHDYIQDKNGFQALTAGRVVPMMIFGEHNMQNLSAAKEACMAAGIEEDEFYKAVRSFTGASKRLEKIHENENGSAYLDFAHSPSKVKATIDAMASRYPGKEIVACLELHTFSSLNIDFINQYRGSMDKAAFKFVYFNPSSAAARKLPPLDPSAVRKAFADDEIAVFDNSGAMFSFIGSMHFISPVFLFMSSGDFDNIDLKALSAGLLAKKS